MLIYTTIIAICWLIFILFWIFSAFSAKKNVRNNVWYKFVWVRIVVSIILVLLIKAGVFDHVSFISVLAPSNPIMGFIGVILTICGVGLAIWARIYLGRNWGMPMSLKENPELVTTGPYAYVRHPIYTGVITAGIGAALGISTIWFIMVVFALIYFTYSATQEEKIMTKEFPDTYPAYKARTKMLIPFVF
jgi:protein-S-isoprenylcysteine O-methyltransferase Ste14